MLLYLIGRIAQYSEIDLVAKHSDNKVWFVNKQKENTSFISSLA